MVSFISKKVKSILSHYNYVHCGVEILSMSKRVLDKVFSCADGCDVKIWYQDTDPIHLNFDGVPIVVTRYKEKYGLELVGEEPWNFHIDFSMDKSNSEIYAVESLFLGRKTYIYIFILESTDKGCTAINSEHIRMKGIPTSCVKYFAGQHNMSVLDLFKKVIR